MAALLVQTTNPAHTKITVMVVAAVGLQVAWVATTGVVVVAAVLTRGRSAVAEAVVVSLKQTAVETVVPLAVATEANPKAAKAS